MRLGYINYLNTYPLYHQMFEYGLPGGIEIVSAYPSELNTQMRKGQLDISPVSAGCFPDIQKDVLMLPDFCLACNGSVKSVILVSNFPIEKLDGRRVGLSSASETSTILLKCILASCFRVAPDYCLSAPMPDLSSGLDAALVIGNEALTCSKQRFPYLYDLGKLWTEHTGHPMVFALFVAGKTFAETNPEAVRDICERYKKSLEIARRDRSRFLEAAKKMYPELECDISAYLKILTYAFTDELKASARIFFRLAGELNLLPPVEEFNYVES